MTDISVRVISWNMGKSIKKISDWNKELEKWSILSNDVDILFITVQEASSTVGHEFANALKSKLGSDYTMISDNEGTLIPFQNFHVFGYLFINKNINIINLPIDNKNNAIDSVCIRKKIFGFSMCTKPSVGLGVIVSKNNKQSKLIFVGSHLPVNVKDKDNNSYGFNERIEAMKIIKKEVIDDLINQLNGYDTIFWAGDMNFRIQDDGVEQLTKLLRTDDLSGYREFIKLFNKTCRYKEYDGNTNYNEFTTNRNKRDGYDQKRIPSYCDRIIYTGKFKPINYFSWPKTDINYPLAIAYSDHEPVVLNGVIHQPTMIGGSNYKSKYHKYKAKYLKLKNELQ